MGITEKIYEKFKSVCLNSHWQLNTNQAGEPDSIRWDVYVGVNPHAGMGMMKLMEADGDTAVISGWLPGYHFELRGDIYEILSGIDEIVKRQGRYVIQMDLSADRPSTIIRALDEARQAIADGLFREDQLLTYADHKIRTFERLQELEDFRGVSDDEY